MAEPMVGAFEHIPRSVQGHFILTFYAAIHRVIGHARRMAESDGKSLDFYFGRYPFVEKYLTEMLQFMPQGISWEDGAAWWERELAHWASSYDGHLPLRALAERPGMSLGSSIALVIVGLVEEDSRFGTLLAHLQEPLIYRRPCLELVAQIMLDGTAPADGDPWRPYQPLISSGFLEVINPESPRSEWTLRVPSVLWGVVRGDPETNLAAWCRYDPLSTFPDLDRLILPEDLREQLRQVPSLVQGGKARAIILRASRGSERRKIMGSIAKALGRGLISVDGSALGSERNALHLGPLASLARSFPTITYDLNPGETVEVPELLGYDGPIGIVMGSEGGLRGTIIEKGVTLTIPSPKANHRMLYWRESLEGYPVDDLDAISERFHIPGDYINQAATMAIAHAALEGRERIGIGDVRQACRSLNRQLLDTLATRLEANGTWDRLVVSPSTGARLEELERRCRHRERLLDYLGPAFGSASNRGVRALFTGPSGTGKTLAARILAAELEMDLYRVDLAAVVNKYIGETEKNLHQVLTTAEELDVILLLDEGDALLGNRTDVKSSNDRYANLETNYLLQRLEHYQGIVLVTTNAGENIDRAFQRRMDVVIDFLPPQALERLNIWQIHLPDQHEVDHGYLEEIAVSCSLTGGQIRNAAMHATLMALDDGGRVNRGHIGMALEGEYRKAGAVSPLTVEGRAPRRARGMQGFIDSIS